MTCIANNSIFSVNDFPEQKYLHPLKSPEYTGLVEAQLVDEIFYQVSFYGVGWLATNLGTVALLKTVVCFILHVLFVHLDYRFRPS